MTQASNQHSKKSVFTLSPLMSGLVLSLGLLVSACQEVSTTNQSSENTPDIAKKAMPFKVVDSAKLAQEIAQKTIIADTHIDLPYRLESKFEHVSAHTQHGDFDFPRAVAGGLNTAFMSIYIPAALEQTGGSKILADKLITMVESIVKEAPAKFALAYSTSDIEENFANGLISLPMGMENGSAIEGSLANLKHFYQRGIRYITLAHAKANHISDSSYDTERPAGGLTDFGKTLVVAMNNIGIMVDVSHISDEAFYDVMAVSKVPVIASHSSARHFTPDFERNMSDEMIKALAKNGGVIQINFGSFFITQAAQDYSKLRKAAIKSYIADNGLEKGSAAVKAFKDDYKVKQPYPYASLAQVLDHFDHVINLVGIDYVGIGSDYDGVGDSLPDQLKDVASYPNLIEGLLKRGYSEADIAKILSGNVMRVWQDTEAYAAEH